MLNILNVYWLFKFLLWRTVHTIYYINDLMENLGSWCGFFPQFFTCFLVLASCLSWQIFLPFCRLPLHSASLAGFLISHNPTGQLGSFPVLLESFRKFLLIPVSWRIPPVSLWQFQCFRFYIKVSDPFWIDFCARRDVVLISSFVCVYSVFPAVFADRLYALP